MPCLVPYKMIFVFRFCLIFDFMSINYFAVQYNLHFFYLLPDISSLEGRVILITMNTLVVLAFVFLLLNIVYSASLEGTGK